MVKVACVTPSGSVLSGALSGGEKFAQSLGLSWLDLTCSLESESGASGTALERATLLASALTRRDVPWIWAGRGGAGTTELVPYLEAMLPPMLPPTTFVGFSDNSFLGTWLAARYPAVRYIHGPHAGQGSRLVLPSWEMSVLSTLFTGGTPRSLSFPVSCTLPKPLSGELVALNLSLAESLAAACPEAFPPGAILFLEEVGEPQFRILRKFDSLANAGILARAGALVLGSLQDCTGPDAKPLDPEDFGRLLARRLSLPVAVFPAFGHGPVNLPLVHGTLAGIDPAGGGQAMLHLSYASLPQAGRLAPPPSGPFPGSRLHFEGIGGTGMATVAGIFQAAGSLVSGSDLPLYPPMDGVLAELGIRPIVGYHASTPSEVRPDAVVIANSISRRNAKLEENREYVAHLGGRAPLYSFPSALRHRFLASPKCVSIVVTGTHGKTTTTSMVASALTALGKHPSFFIGGSTKNFPLGFSLANPNLFILEGDEYDTALFDKGPKFLSYEPRIAVIGNLEYDHADIYANLQAIEDEFTRLLEVTALKQGIAVVNWDCPRVHALAGRSGVSLLTVGREGIPGPGIALLDVQTHAQGTRLTLGTPWGEVEVHSVLFGEHNARNSAAGLGVLTALYALESGLVRAADIAQLPPPDLGAWGKALGTCTGVRKRFELIGMASEIAVFEDFAHHPTAVRVTLAAFREYMAAAQRTGRLILCFDPRNATLRRNFLQGDLARACSEADLVLLGRPAQDARIPEGERFDPGRFVQETGAHAQAYGDTAQLLDSLVREAAKGDTVVFMSSGAFDNAPRDFLSRIQSRL